MTEEQVRAMLEKAVGRNAARWARENGCSTSLVGAFLQGKEAPGPKILTALGIEKVVTYRKAKPPQETKPHAT